MTLVDRRPAPDPLRGGPGKRVCFVVDWWWPDEPGGAERTAREIAIGLARDGHQVDVVRPGTHTRHYSDGPIDVHQIRTLTLRRAQDAPGLIRGVEFLRSMLLPYGSRRIAAMVESLAPDVIVVTNIARQGPLVIRRLARRARDSRVLRIHHDLTDICLLRSQFRNDKNCVSRCPACRLRTKAARVGAADVDQAFAVSTFLCDQLVGAGVYPAERVCAAHPLVPARIARPQRPSKSDGERLRIGFLGRIIPEKGLQHLLDAAALWPPGQVEVKVAGDISSTYAQALKRTADAGALPVSWLGIISPADFAAEIDVIVVPSLWAEPFGRVPAEFVALRRAVVVAPAGGLTETAELYPGCVTLARSAEPADLAAAIIVAMETVVPAADVVDVGRVHLTLERTVAQWVGHAEHSSYVNRH